MESVSGLEANPGLSLGQTDLKWNLSGQQGVVSYHIYFADTVTPYFSRIGTVAQGTAAFTTAVPWCGDASIAVSTFAVTAVRTDGTESFFSEFAQNNDRDHDGLTDADETAHGTDWNNQDTDGDGYLDGIEVQNGSDPLDPLSPPHAVQDAITTPEDIPVTIPVLANDLGAIGVTLAIGSVEQQPSHGTAVVSGTGILYTPAADWSGIDTFTYTASDGATGNAATVTVTVTPVNDPPTLGAITPSTAATAPGTAQAFSAVYSDIEGYADIATAQFDVGSGALCLSAKYDRAANKLWLRDDAGTSWIGGCTPGSAGTIVNSLGEVNCAVRQRSYINYASLSCS